INIESFINSHFQFSRFVRMSVLFSVTIAKFIPATTRTNPRNLRSLYRIVSKASNSSDPASPVYLPTEKRAKVPLL
ncbi:hypothetical protein, partial [Bacillus mycoides]|uniref:hypothetical protein n=2 Tax=Bacillus cereus group TaxID=86661 RepID=UPI001E49C622